jgi:hypothetical protein
MGSKKAEAALDAAMEGATGEQVGIVLKELGRDMAAVLNATDEILLNLDLVAQGRRPQARLDEAIATYQTLRAKVTAE